MRRYWSPTATRQGTDTQPQAYDGQGWNSRSLRCTTAIHEEAHERSTAPPPHLENPPRQGGAGERWAASSCSAGCGGVLPVPRSSRDSSSPFPEPPSPWTQQPLLPGESERRHKPRVSEEQVINPTVTFRGKTNSQEVCCQELGGEPSRSPSGLPLLWK